ncbi:MAG: phosphotransferase [Thermoplasmataceae archaeon]
MEVSDLSESGIRRRIGESFPDIPVRDLKLDDSGWNYVAALVNGSIVFRFPRTNDLSERLRKEIVLISGLKGFPFRLPEYLLMPTNGDFFAGYRYIPGFPLNSAKVLGIGLLQDSTRVLRYFLRYNASVLPDEGIPVYSPESWIKNRVEGVAKAFRDALSRYIGDDYFDLVNERINSSLGNLTESDMVLSHGDLFRGNVVINAKHSCINGVIDWEETSIGDIALDIAALGMDFHPLYTRRLVSSIGKNDTGLMKRIAFYQWFEPLFTAYHKVQQGEYGNSTETKIRLQGPDK